MEPGAPYPDTAGVALLPRLPAPRRERWQPLRLGLVNLYRFDQEELAFEDGRLLLRGNNGTGKSRVLALTLPFLFDGRMEPHRVEPDGDSAKRMEWNLLMGRHEDRLGYAWLEFGRLDGQEEGTGAAMRFVTIGCGLRATAGRGAPQIWFFVTDQRVGENLRLVADTGQALTRDRLEEAVGPSGQVVETAKEYRRLVDRALFGLGEYRYDALVDLLIQLRRPQLSRQLDEELLSHALSEALPPLPAGVVADVAEAFRALDDDRDQLDGFQAALRASEEFLRQYGTYASVAARRVATALTRANSRYERTRAQLRDAERRRETAAAEVLQLESERDELTAAEAAAAVEVHTLETSPEMEAAHQLDETRLRARELAEAAADRESDLARAVEDIERLAAEARSAEEAATTTREAVVASSATASTRAAAAELPKDHARAVAPLLLPDVRDLPAVAGARQAISAAIERVRGAAEHLATHAESVRVALVELDGARGRLDERTSERDRARDDAADAEAEVASARRALVEALREWVASLDVLEGVDVDGVAERLLTWSGPDAPPVAEAAARAESDVRERLTRALTELDGRLHTIEGERTEVLAERGSAAAGVHRPPPAPHTRAGATRDGRPGAPFWQLLEPRDHLDDRSAAGYEAALEASGLLDAWVTPDGALLDADDSVLVAVGAPERADGCLGELFLPASTSADGRVHGVPAQHVAALLNRIGARPEGEVWVASDGRWRLGPLHGRWTKDASEHLGAAARDRARRRRLAVLGARLVELDADAEELRSERAATEGRLARAERERAAAPAEEDLRRAIFAEERATADLRREQQRVEAAERQVVRLRGMLDEAEAKRDEAAADLGLAGRAADPSSLRDDVHAYAVASAELWAAVTVHTEALRRLDGIAAERRRTDQEHELRRGQARVAREAANAAQVRRATLEAAVGSTVAQVVARLEAARGRQHVLMDRLRAVQARREDRLQERARAEGEVGIAAALLEEHTGDRMKAVDRFRALALAGFLRVAGVALDDEVPAREQPWAPDPAVRAARRVNDALGDVVADDARWERVQGGLHGHYTILEHALLPHALQPALGIEQDLLVVTTSYQGQSVSVPELRDRLADEVLSRQSVLDAREREVLENHLVGEVATQLHELIRNGEALVASMNREIEARPTSTGMRLRFAWRARSDGPEALQDARRRLLAADHVWSAEDREALGAFLQGRIREVREVDETGTWQQHLTLALDYRRWHLFSVEREQEGQWVRLTRRTHGTGSGGEKALALTVPQFAAAAAHYRSADAHAPRLIALDEAFVGIDADMRAKCLDLLVQFDLDVAMTSEREWACYPTVPAIAIHQFSTRPGIDAVGIHRWLWNGRDRLEVRLQDGNGS